jgi:hypothetical protein
LSFSGGTVLPVHARQRHHYPEGHRANRLCEWRHETGHRKFQAQQPGAAAAPVFAKAAVAPSGEAQVQVTSAPDGADIEIDGIFVGDTPSVLGVASGQHDIAVKKNGFKLWERMIAVSSGQVHVNAVLEPDAK